MELNRQTRCTDRAKSGIIRFRGYDSQSKDSPFIGVKHNHDMKEVWQMMTDDDHWRLPLPKLLISVTGEAKTLTPHPRVKAILKQGLVNAAANTGAWIITGGRATGMMKMVGEAVSEYADATGNQTGQELVVLGIISLGCVANRHLFKEKALQKNGRKPLTYIMPGEMRDSHCAPLDHNHTHFLLVDDGTERQPGGEIDFGSDLEKYISTQKKDSQDVKIPTVLVVVEGGVNTLKTVRKSLKRGSPVVVISGSGRAADLLSEAKKLDMRRDGSRTGITLTTTKDILDVSDEMACRALGDINECLREDRKNNLVNIFNPAAADSGTNFEREILCALLKAQNLKVNQQVSLAMAWNHCDIAKQCIFSSENSSNWQEADLSSSMLDALVEDQADFVQLFLDLGLDLERFLCVETLWQLYSKCLAKSAVAKELLTYSSSRITSTATTTQYEVGLDLKDNPHLLFDISKVIVHLLKDNSFNFYSDFHVLGEGFQYPSFKHPERELFLWSILFNRRDLAQIVWKDGLDHIGGALCARALLKEMSVIAEEMEMAEFSEDLAKHSVEWEAHALTVLAECYSRDHLLTHNLLVRELRHWAPEESALLCTSDTAGHPAHTNTPDTAGRPTPLSMTESYEMTDFAGHSACQTKLTDIWNGGLAGNTSIWKICLCIFLPFLIFSIKFTDDSRPKNKDDQSFKGRKNSIFPQDPGCSPKKVETCQEEEDAGRRDQDLNLRLKSVSLCATGPDSIDFGQALYYFYTAPVTKFVFNIISYLCFLALFSYVMLVELNKTSPRAEEYVIWGWTLTMVAEGFRRMLFRDQPSMKYRIRNWFRDLWNKFDAAIFLCMFLSVILRCSMLFYEGDFRWVRVLYSVTIVLCFLRCLQFFYAFPSIGPKVIMIQKMMTDMLPFLAIVLVFVIGFGVAFHANIFPNAPADWSILANVLYFPYFHIFGELFLDNLEGEEVDGCVKNETQKRNGLITPCPEKTPAALSMFLAVYLILTNILLVNLLIAMFSYKFQKVEELSLNAWRLNRLSLVHEYCDRSCLAPPLVIFDHAFRVLRTCCASKHDILLEQKYNAFRWELSPEDCWRLTLFEKNAAEKCLLPAANVSKEINGKWTETHDVDDLARKSLHKINTMTSPFIAGMTASAPTIQDNQNRNDIDTGLETAGDTASYMWEVLHCGEANWSPEDVKTNYHHQDCTCLEEIRVMKATLNDFLDYLYLK